MAKHLRVLIVEDSEDDALLVIRELKRGGYETMFERVETAEAMTAALEKQVWDIIIADYRLPHFSAPEALELFHQSGLDLPFIVISGAVGEETAVATMKAGAHDYLMKDNLTRLVPAVERELREAEVRKERKQAEETVRASEEKYSQLFQLGSDALFLIEVKTGKILDLNNAAIEMYGYSREEALQMKNTDFSAEPDKTRKATLESEKHIPVRYHRRKDGTIFPTDISVAYYTWYGKEVCVDAIRDTTERKKAVDDLKQAAEEWRTTFDSIADLVSIHDKDFRLVRLNKAFADMFNMKPEELVGKTCYQVVHGTNECVPHCPHMKTLETREPAIANFFEPHLGIHLELFTSPIFNDKGEVVASVHVVRDITERKRAEEELEKHREHLEELVKERTAELTKANQHLRQQIEERKRAEEALRESENGLAEAQRIAHMGNWDLDLDKNELRWSDEIYRIFGLKPQEFGATYEAFLNTVHPDDREFVDTSYTKSIKSDTPYDIVHRIVRPDGGVRYVHEKAEDIKDETGKTIRSIGTVQDITERKEAEDALKKSTAELQKMVNLMAGREVRMAELKETIRKLRAQLEEAGQTPVADDPLKEGSQK